MNNLLLHCNKYKTNWCIFSIFAFLIFFITFFITNATYKIILIIILYPFFIKYKYNKYNKKILIVSLFIICLLFYFIKIYTFLYYYLFTILLIGYILLANNKIILTKINKNHKFNKSNFFKKKYNLLSSIALIFIILLSIFLRFKNLGNSSLNGDEIYNASYMKCVLENGFPVCADNVYYTRGIFQTYFGAFFSLFFGINELSIRIPSAISGVLIVIVMYSIGKKFINKNIGLLLAFISCLFPWFIEISRDGRMYNMLTLLILTNFYFSCLAFEKKYNTKYIILSILTIILSILTHMTGMITVIFFLLSFIVFNFKKKIFKNKKIIVSIILLLFIMPFSFIFRGLLKGYSTLDSFLAFYTYMIRLYQYYNYYEIFIYNQYPLAIIGIIIFILIVITKKRNKELYLLISLLLCIFLAMFFNLKSYFVPRYVFFTIPFIILACTFGFYFLFLYLFSLIFKTIKAKTIKILSIIPTIFIINIIFLDIKYSFNIQYRKHEFEYKNIHYAPFSSGKYKKKIFHFNTKENNLLSYNLAKKNDIIISSRYLCFMFYTNKEADYASLPDIYHKCHKDEICIQRLTKQTIWANTSEKLINIIEKSKNKNIYIVSNFPNNIKYSTKTIEFIKILKKKYFLQKIFEGKDKTSTIHLIKK